jgi:hypothetical protein
MYSTRTTGVFLLPLLLFLPIGLYQAFRRGDAASMVLVVGFLTAPLAAVLVGEPGAIGRALELLPFGVLLAVVGMLYVWSGPRVALRRVLCLAGGLAGVFVGIGYASWTAFTQGRISASTPLLVVVGVVLVVAGLVTDRAAGRMAVTALLAVGAIQFGQFLHDYFTDYRARAAEAFHFNRRGGMEQIIARARSEDVPAIYLSGDIDMVEQYWQWYVVKNGRRDLLPRTVIFGGTRPLESATLLRGSAILAPVSEPVTQSLEQSGELTLDALIPEPGGRPFYALYRR